MHRTLGQLDGYLRFGSCRYEYLAEAKWAANAKSLDYRCHNDYALEASVGSILFMYWVNHAPQSSTSATLITTRTVQGFIIY